MKKTLEQLEAAFPAIASMPADKKAACFEMYNAKMKDGMDEKAVVSDCVSRCTDDMSERMRYTTAISLGDGKKESTIEVLRVGTIRDRGLVITKQMLEDYVANHAANVYGTPLQVNLGHNREGEAAGWIKDLFIEGERLMARIEWTELGVDKLTKKLYQFVSSELAPKFPHADTGKPVSNVFIGAALTNTPALKHQEPIALSEKDFVPPSNGRDDLNHKHTTMFKKLMEDLKGRAKLSAEDIKLAETFLSEADASEQEQGKKDIAALGEKLKTQLAAEAEEKKKHDDQLLAEGSKKNGVSPEEHKALKEKVELNELKEKVSTDLVLSDKRDVGLLGEHAERAAKFMLGLSEAERKEFTELMGLVKHVDLSTRGGAGAKVDLKEEDEATAICALAEQLFKDKKAPDMGAAQAMAAKEIAAKKSAK